MKSSVINALILYNDNSGRVTPITPLTLLEFTKSIIEEWSDIRLEEDSEPEPSGASGLEEEVEAVKPEPGKHITTWQSEVKRRTTGLHSPEIHTGFCRQSGTYVNPRSNVVFGYV